MQLNLRQDESYNTSVRLTVCAAQNLSDIGKVWRERTLL